MKMSFICWFYVNVIYTAKARDVDNFFHMYLFGNILHVPTQLLDILHVLLPTNQMFYLSVR